MIDDFISFLKGMIRKSVSDDKTPRFVSFFTSALYFEPKTAEKLTYYYLGIAEMYNFRPGLGVTLGRSTPSDRSELAMALRKVGIGTTCSLTSLKTRLAEYLVDYATPNAAKSALTPAKRDALRMEAIKLLSIPEEVWMRYYRSPYAAIGVRG